MDTRHPLPLLLLAVAFVGCRQDVPTSLEHRGPLFSAAQSSDATWIVDDDGAECPGAQFTSIQAAVDEAAPGDRILVCNGTYHEQVTVSKNDLRIVAADEPQRAVVQGHDFGFLVLSASGVTIQGFHVEHAHEADIALVGTTGSTVRHNVTSAAGHDGIQLAGSDDNLIEHNVAIDNLAVNACGINLIAARNGTSCATTGW